MNPRLECPRKGLPMLAMLLCAPLALAQSPGEALDAAWQQACANAEPGSAFAARCQDIINAGPGSGNRRSAAAAGNNLGVVAAQARVARMARNAARRAGTRADVDRKLPGLNLSPEDEADALLAGERWGLVLSAFYGDLERDGSERESGFDADETGVLVGLDYRFTDRLVGVLGVEWRDGGADYSGGAGSLDQEALTLSGALYCECSEHFGWQVTAGRGEIDYDLERRIRFSIVRNAGQPNEDVVTVDSRARGQTDGTQSNAGFTLDWYLPRAAWQWRFSAGADWQHLEIDGFRETEAVGFALGYAEQTSISLQGRVGAELSRVYSLDWGVLSPFVRADWVHEFRDDPRLLNVFFRADQVGFPIRFLTEEPDRNFGRVGVGAIAVLPNAWQGFVGIERTVAHEFLDETRFSVGLRKGF